MVVHILFVTNWNSVRIIPGTDVVYNGIVVSVQFQVLWIVFVPFGYVDISSGNKFPCGGKSCPKMWEIFTNLLIISFSGEQIRGKHVNQIIGMCYTYNVENP